MCRVSGKTTIKNSACLIFWHQADNQQFYYRIILLKERNYLIIITSENVSARLFMDKITFKSLKNEKKIIKLFFK